jgi:hypothetical protein
MLEEKFECIIIVDVDGITTHSRPGDSFEDNTTSGINNDDVTM